MPVDTAAVTREPPEQSGAGRREIPTTGSVYLDAVLAQPGCVLAMAHRGGAPDPEVLGAENTLTAFRRATSLGYRYLETDVHATSDGVLVAFHDEVLDRVTDRTGRLADLSSEEVSFARIAQEHEVPLMADLLEQLPDTFFNIDVKSAGAVQPLVDLIDAQGAHDRVCVGAFSWRRLRDFRRASAGRVATSAAPVEVVAFLVGAPALRLLGAPMGGRPLVLQLPWRHRTRRLSVITPRLVRRAHAAGMQVHAWTGDASTRWVSIDDPASINALLDLGVDGLIVDRTDLLKDVLLARGQWMGATP